MRRFSLIAAALAAVFLAGCARNEEIPLGGVAVKPSEITIAKGESRNLSFIIEPEGASYIGLYWQSDNEEVASVDQKGVVSGLSVGSATITLYVDSFRSSCEVTVTGGAVESYRIEPEALSLFIGQTRQLTYTYAPSDAEFDASLLEWSSSDDKVVTVDRNGNIEAVGTGKASVILSDGNVSGECEVSVVAEASAGDFFYSDGTWSPELDVTKECIGIVFFAGHHENDNTDYSGTGIGTVKCHGYVVALDDANGQSCFWGPQGTALGNYPVNEYDEKIPVELSNVEDADWNGYAYTQNMKAAAEASGGLAPDTEKGYPAAYYALNYGTDAPANTSGWFLPSISQLYVSAEMEEEKIAEAGGAGFSNRAMYASSTEFWQYPEDMILYSWVGINMLSMEGKDFEAFMVRPVLAF